MNPHSESALIRGILFAYNVPCKALWVSRERGAADSNGIVAFMQSATGFPELYRVGTRPHSDVVVGIVDVLS